MAANNEMVLRLRQQIKRIKGMMNPGMKKEYPENDAFNFSPISKFVGGRKYLTAANKMRSLRKENNPIKNFGSITKFKGMISSKFNKFQKLINLSPKSMKTSSFWQEVDKVYFNRFGRGGGEEPSSGNELRRGSVIQSAGMFPKPGQTFESFKEQAQSKSLPRKRTTPPKRVVPRPKDRLFAHVEEITNKVPEELEQPEQPKLEEVTEEVKTPTESRPEPKVEEFKPQPEKIRKIEKIDEEIKRPESIKAPVSEGAEELDKSAGQEAEESYGPEKSKKKPPLKMALPVKKSHTEKPKPLLKAKPSISKKQTVQRQQDLPVAKKVEEVQDQAEQYIWPERKREEVIELPLADPKKGDLPIEESKPQKRLEKLDTKEAPLSKSVLRRRSLPEQVKIIKQENIKPLSLPKILPTKKMLPLFSKQKYGIKNIVSESKLEPSLDKVNIRQANQYPEMEKIRQTDQLTEAKKINIPKPKFDLPVPMILSNSRQPEIPISQELEPPSPKSSEPQIPRQNQSQSVQAVGSNVVQRLWEEHGGSQSDSGGGSQPAPEMDSGESDQSEIDLDQLAEDIYPLVKQILEIEAERISNYFR